MYDYRVVLERHDSTRRSMKPLDLRDTDNQAAIGVWVYCSKRVSYRLSLPLLRTRIHSP